MRTILLLIFMLLALDGSAVIDCIIIYERSGASNVIPLKEIAQISFDGNKLNAGSYSFPLHTLQRYEFADSENAGIMEIEGYIEGIKIDPTGIIDIGDSQKEVAVFNLQSLPCNFKRTGSVVDITSLTSGIYVIKIGNSSFKLLKK